jgi:hypothetical protein
LASRAKHRLLLGIKKAPAGIPCEGFVKIYLV